MLIKDFIQVKLTLRSMFIKAATRHGLHCRSPCNFPNAFVWFNYVTLCKVRKRNVSDGWLPNVKMDRKEVLIYAKTFTT